MDAPADGPSTDLSVVMVVTLKQELKKVKMVRTIQKKHRCRYFMINVSHVKRMHAREKMTSLRVMLTSITRMQGTSSRVLLKETSKISLFASWWFC